jgi:hypothetical protein
LHGGVVRKDLLFAAGVYHQSRGNIGCAAELIAAVRKNSLLVLKSYSSNPSRRVARYSYETR